MSVRVRDVMTHLLVTVGPQEPVAHARRLLADHGFGALPVVDRDGRVVGIVGAADLLDVPERSAAATVASMMSTPVLTADPRTEVHVLAHRLDRYGGHRVMPVVERGRLVGMVTRGDLLRGLPRGGPVGRLARRVRDAIRGGTPGSGAADLDRPTLRVVGGPSGPPPAPEPPSRSRRARDVMNSHGPLLTVTATTTTERAAELMSSHHVGELPVVDDRGVVVGIVGEADLRPDRERRPATVAAVMTTDVRTLGPDADVGELSRLLGPGGLRSIPITEDGVVLGVVSRRDLI